MLKKSLELNKYKDRKQDKDKHEEYQYNSKDKIYINIDFNFIIDTLFNFRTKVFYLHIKIFKKIL